jgi:hypothetical protein
MFEYIYVRKHLIFSNGESSYFFQGQPSSNYGASGFNNANANFGRGNANNFNIFLYVAILEILLFRLMS